MSEKLPIHDPNLIFGVLALQAGLITQQQFAEGCAAWAARRDTSLGQILQERGWIKADDRSMIERLALRHPGPGTPPSVSQSEQWTGAPRSPGPQLTFPILLLLVVLGAAVLSLGGTTAWLWLWASRQAELADEQQLAVEA